MKTFMNDDRLYNKRDVETGKSDCHHPTSRRDARWAAFLGSCCASFTNTHTEGASQHTRTTDETHVSCLSATSNTYAVEEGEARSAIETRVINRLRLLTLIILLSIATLASVGVHRYSFQTQQNAFEVVFHDNTNRIIGRFYSTIEQKLTSIHALSDKITSHALTTGAKFPMVTLPHFALHAGNVRIQSDAAMVRYTPIVTDETRKDWEDYAFQHRHLYDEDYLMGVELREHQDALYNINLTYVEAGPKFDENDTMVDDGTYYHPHIFNNGAISPRGDAPIGSGPYLPLWQKRYVCFNRRYR